MPVNIYGQDTSHDQVKIVGTVEELNKLRGAIEDAIRDKVAHCGLYASDGEGYIVSIAAVKEEKMRDLEVPYSNPMHFGPHNRAQSPEDLFKGSPYNIDVLFKE